MPVIRIRKEILTTMLAHARADQSRECCGLLAGRNAIITKIFSAENVAPTPATSYDIAPRQLFAFMKEMRTAELEFLGIYHSHPTSDNSPSPTDIARVYYPDVAYFILSPLLAVSNPIRAFSIQNARATELQIEIVAT